MKSLFVALLILVACAYLWGCADVQERSHIVGGDEEALYIKEVTEEKSADPVIQETVQAHREDVIYLQGPYRGQMNGEIQQAYDERGRYEELADPKYTEIGAIFDIIAMTVIQTHLAHAA